MTFNINNTTIKGICNFEGLVLTAYKCPAGVWTIGYGHTKGVKRGQRITKEQAVEYLKQDIQPIINYLNKLNVCKTQGQFGALVSFIFNLGVGNFQKSTLYKYIKQNKSDDMICAQFMRWTKSGGRVLPGLVKRRQWECNMWRS